MDREQIIEEDDEDYDDFDGEEVTVCPACNGSGGDPWNDGCLPCEHCDGEGYQWWL